MSDVRAIVVARMKSLGWSPYRLAKAVRDHMTPQTVYGFVSGDSEMKTDALGHLLDALGLEVAETKPRAKPSARRQARR